MLDMPSVVKEHKLETINRLSTFYCGVRSFEKGQCYLFITTTYYQSIQTFFFFLSIVFLQMHVFVFVCVYVVWDYKQRKRQPKPNHEPIIAAYQDQRRKKKRQILLCMHSDAEVHIDGRYDQYSTFTAMEEEEKEKEEEYKVVEDFVHIDNCSDLQTHNM
ncbi:hypothetical protein RFI_34069 [Reticulomyxa filosa]|uniref:Uncharacterized protein n=1 Tax=Reticulomyxa filosa TaxID=46433 RepID=X6LRH7_RETFI|nr:hypothetical protein RFI_34069 [Reticulomyxa filosa]|eukprot:ETO03340.1 hypothetical protein RFI_34069 [Reticulomyxa filosa]